MKYYETYRLNSEKYTYV